MTPTRKWTLDRPVPGGEIFSTGPAGGPPYGVPDDRRQPMSGTRTWPARSTGTGPLVCGVDAVDLREEAERIVWAATRAPSYRNIQPWSFRVSARQVEVYADLSRRCPVADPDDRQLFLGVGAAVFGVRLALARLGRRPVVC